VGKEIEVLLPDIGDFSGVEIIEILVGPGDRVAVEDPLIVLESDKATLEVPAPQAGEIKQLKVKVGDKVSEGDLLLTMDVEAGADAQQEDKAPETEATKDEAAPMEKPQPEPSKAEPVEQPPAEATSAKAHASPAVRRFAHKLGVDLSQVQGSASHGRILKEDVQQFVAQRLSEAPAATGAALPSIPEVDFSQFGEIDKQPLGRIKKLSGAHLHKCWVNVPHVTQFDEVDITELEAFRQALKETTAQKGARLTIFTFLLQACAAVLKEMPEFNSSLAGDGEHLIYKKYIHIGVAVDTPNGLVVPVIRDVDKKSGLELARELGEVSERARQGKLTPKDMQGGCFTISSLGGIGGTHFTPIVNAPEVAILGVSRSSMKPVWDGNEFQPRLMLPLALSYDHRVIDGAQGVRFTTRLVELLGDIRRLLL
jgi:pyruvate dehydrogenase E2 component (dihydrolipoamide acetyltransferase)